MRRIFRLALLTPLLALGACNFAPDYAPPQVEMPTKFKEGAHEWREARPSDDAPRGPWWKALNDHNLDELEPQVEAANPDLAAALAALDQARAYVAKAQAGLLPELSLDNGYSSNKSSAHRPHRKADTPLSAAGVVESWLDNRPLNEPDHYGDNILKLQASYEVDLWGRVRNTVAQGEAHAQATAAEMETVRLGLQAELARTYVALRGLDSDAQLLTKTVAAYRQALELTKTRVQGDIASPADSARAEAQLEAVRAILFDVEARRALLEHAVATLIGKPASSFSLSPAPHLVPVPAVPPGAPSALLERRPDIAAAEREVAAANASIGVARAAFFPKLTINLSAGTEDTGLSLFNLRNSIWSLGPAVTLPIFDGGSRAAELSRTESVYLETVSRYRSVVLHSIQEVEDNLALLRWLAKEQKSLETAAAAAERVLTISLALYRDGATNYLDVVTAQTAALDAERAVISVKTRRLEASVGLMLALGGGWSVVDKTVAGVE